jgi:beta-glucosidase
VPQLYLGLPSAPRVPQPPAQLKGYAAVRLRPGESRTVAMNLTARSFSFWSTAVHGWRRARGCVRVMVGTSSRDLPLRRTLSQGGARC